MRREAATSLALLATLNAQCANAEQLAQAATEAFQQHPDHEIITSFPGLSELTCARLLAEIGGDRARFADARALKAYAGSAPVTLASGRSISITCRRVKKDRLAAVGFVWHHCLQTGQTYDPIKAFGRARTLVEPTAVP